MVKKGVQVICTGCGTNTFIESDSVKSKIGGIKDGSHSRLYNENQSSSWARVQLAMDLCPRCHKVYEDILCKFYDECGERRGEEEADQCSMQIN